MLSAYDNAIAKLNRVKSEQEIDCIQSNHLISNADNWHETVRNMKRKPLQLYLIDAKEDRSDKRRSSKIVG